MTVVPLARRSSGDTRPEAPERSRYLAALDIGSSKVCCMIAEVTPDRRPPPGEIAHARLKVRGVGHQASRGVKNGVIVNLDEAERLCHRIAVIKRTVLRVDSPAALRSAIYGRATIARVRTLTDGMIAAVRAVPGVASLGVNDGTLIAACDPEAANPAIARALLGAGAELLSLAEQHKTLEDVYLELVREPPS